MDAGIAIVLVLIIGVAVGVIGRKMFASSDVKAGDKGKGGGVTPKKGDFKITEAEK